MRRNRTFFPGLLSLGVIVMVGALSVYMVAGWKDCSVFDVPAICLNLSAEETIRFIRSAGAWGVAGSVGLMVLRTVIPFPASIIPIANGMIYGGGWGVAITWAGAMLSAFLAFGLARYFGRSFVHAMLSGKQRGRLDAWSKRTAAVDLFLVRLLPVISFNLINYTAGLTPVSPWTFTWTTALGILPATVFLVVLGDQAMAMPWWGWLLMATGVVLLWILIRKRMRRFSRMDIIEKD